MVYPPLKCFKTLRTTYRWKNIPQTLDFQPVSTYGLNCQLCLNVILHSDSLILVALLREFI